MKKKQDDKFDNSIGEGFLGIGDEEMMYVMAGDMD
jgi:hypothetical protein